MGCDIHAQIQVRTQSGDWKSVGTPDDSRQYLFFEMLTATRANNDFVGVMPAERGLPAETSYRWDYGAEPEESFGDHSFTWWTLAEMKAALPKAEAFCAKDMNNRETALERFKDWLAMGDMLGRHHQSEGDDDVRFVVGYDN